MIRRLLVLLLVVGATVWWLRRLLAPAARRAPRPRRVEPPARDEGRMVRDRVCNTFLPLSRALVERVAGEEHFFCSESCRRQYLASRDADTA